MNKFLVGGVVVALILGVVALVKDKTVVVQNGEKVEVGAFSPYLAVTELNLGGLRFTGLKPTSLKTGTSTVCAIASPSATSTLITAGVNFTLASSSAVVVDMANSPDPYATTTGTRINGSGYAVGASKQATIVASSTGSVAGDATIFAPNRYFVAKFHDPNVASNNNANASTGSCWAVFAVTP